MIVGGFYAPWFMRIEPCTKEIDERNYLMQPLGLIVAIANNGVIGTETNELPWHYPEDMKHFKETTMFHPLIMGRKTYESLPKRPLPKRHNIILSRNIENCPSGLASTKETDRDYVSSVQEALEKAQTGLYKDAMPIVMGGAQVYNLFLPLVTKMWVTHIKKDYDGSVKLSIDYSKWSKTESKDFGEFEIATYVKIPTVAECFAAAQEAQYDSLGLVCDPELRDALKKS